MLYSHFTNQETSLSDSLIHNIKHCAVLPTQIKVSQVEFVNGKFPEHSMLNICMY